jgi:antitoxin YefM
MISMNATDVRREWSKVIDTAIREKPVFIKRTRDQVMISNVEHIKSLLNDYHFIAVKFTEEDASITLSLNELDIVANGSTLKLAKQELAKNLLEYAEEFYQDFAFWSKAPNRKSHIPYVLKILLYEDMEELISDITCQPGKKF